MKHNAAIFTRRDMLKAGGALVVGFSFAGVAGCSQPAVRGVTAGGPPDPNAVDSWLAVHADNTASVNFGKCELGQGNTTGLLQIVGEELDLDMAQLSAVRLETDVTPDQGATSSSSSIHRGGPPLRAAAAEARQALLTLASVRLGEQPGSLVVDKGVVSVQGQPTRSVTYGELIGGKKFAVKLSGTAPLKPPRRYKLVGQSVPRVDMPEKASGQFVRIQNVRVPGMLHGRIVLPRGQRAYGSGAKVVSLDESSIAGIAGARVIRKGDFIGIVAEREWDAVKAARDLKVVWADGPKLPRDTGLLEQMRAMKSNDTVIADYGDATAAFDRAAHTASGTYFGPYQGHIPFSPNCAVADVNADGALIQSGTQNIYASRAELAAILRLPIEKVRVQYYESSGTFGRSCYEDAAQAAALLSQAVGRPVRVQFMRWDEHGWDNYGPPHLAEVRAAIDAAGNLIAYEYHGWQHGWTTRATVHDLVLDVTTPERDGGSNSITVNPISTGSMYKVANRRVISHAIPMEGLLRGAALRSPLDLNYGFASEQTIDELAFAAKTDPLEFRRKNIGGQRWLDVLNAAAKAASWTPRVASSSLSDADVVTGRGIGIATHHVSYGAAVAEVEVNKVTGNILVKRLYGALDCGLAVNPGLIENQIVGQMVQTVSRMLKEEVLFDEKSVSSLDWATYPILRFAEHPEVIPIVVQRLEEPSTGAGEEVMGATAAAIANAVFDATGVRLHRYPMTPGRVKQALAAGTNRASL
jgi:CO/xanthine dehydrogenase Mo-binding subunit